MGYAKHFKLLLILLRRRRVFLASASPLPGWLAMTGGFTVRTYTTLEYPSMRLLLAFETATVKLVAGWLDSEDSTASN